MAQTELFQTENIVLDALPFHVEHMFDERIGSTVRDSIVLEANRRETLDAMVYTLSGFVLAEKLVDKRIHKSHIFEHKVRYPRSWWQHFKQDVLDRTWLTRWFVDRRPVRFKTEFKREVVRLQADFTQYATFPAADIKTPPGIHHNIVVPKEELNVFWGHPRV